jgi:hypothetical protein
MVYNSRLIGLIRCARLNQRSFSVAAGLEYTALSHIITGRRTPTKEQRFVIARYFKTDDRDIDKTAVYIFGKEKVNGPSNGKGRRGRRIRTGI